MADKLVELRAGDAGLLLCPEVGGTIVRYWSEGAGGPIEWLRPGLSGGRLAAGAGDMGCFPLVPYSNRIRHGRFRFSGREIALPLNFGDHPHSIHGQGWQSPWTLMRRTENEAILEYAHRADAWPFPYRARQVFRLEPGALSVTMTLENHAATAMPAGLGFHPYFPRTPRTRLTAAVESVWLTDAEVMPTRRERPPEAWNLTRGIDVDAVTLDNGFTGWGHEARIDYPESGRRLTLGGEDGLDFLVVYTPRGERFFCAEPVSHCTDAFNRAAAGEAGTGMRTLAPGERWSVTMRLRPERG